MPAFKLRVSSGGLEGDNAEAAAEDESGGSKRRRSKMTLDPKWVVHLDNSAQH